MKRGLQAGLMVLFCSIHAWGATLVASFTPGANRNNFAGYVGLKFTATAFSVTTLGLRCATGNSGSHNVYLLNGSNTTLASASINLTGCTVGTFYYASVTSTALSNGTAYYLATQVTSGGQNFADTGAVTLNSIGSSPNAIFSSTLGSFTSGAANQMFAGVDINGATAGTDYPRSASDGSLSESAGRMVAYGRSGSDGTLAEAIARSFGPVRAAADGTLSEAMARILASTRNSADGSLSESLTRLRDVPVGLSDGTLLVNTNRSLGFIRGPVDGSLSESADRSQGFVRSEADGSLTVLVDRAGVFSRSADDTGFVSVVVFDGHAYIVNLASTMFFSEAVLRSGVFSRSMVGKFDIGETISRSGSFRRSIADSALASSLVTSVSSGGTPLVVIPLDHVGVYPGVGRVAVYRGFVKVGIYTKPVTVVVVQ